MIDPATGWFEIAEVPSFDIEDVKKGNRQLIDKTSARISQVFNQVWLSRYPLSNTTLCGLGYLDNHTWLNTWLILAEVLSINFWFPFFASTAILT